MELLGKTSLAQRFDEIYTPERLKHLLTKPFSDKDVKALATLGGHGLKVINYNELEKYHSIEELLFPYGAALILYEWKPSFGHWVALFYSPIANRIEFFDPYGYIPDDEKRFIPKDMWKMNYLTQLLNDAAERGWDIEYNHYQFQSRQFQDISTCGRWVGIRLLLRRLPLYKFAHLFRNIEGPSDAVVTILSHLLINK